MCEDIVSSINNWCAAPAGDNVIVGSREGKLCWFDMDLSSQPYKILRYAFSSDALLFRDLLLLHFRVSYQVFLECR